MMERFMANIGAKIKEFQRKMKQVDAAVKKAAMGAEVPVGADTAEAKRKMLSLQAVKQALNKKVVIPIEARINNFQKTMNRVSNFIHSLDNVMANALGGSLLMISPAAVPLLASLVGLLGSLGPMIGVIGGSTFALATAFGFAGSAAIAFGAVAIPTISKLFNETEKLTKAQKAAKAEYTNFQKTWKGIVKDLERPVLEAFGKSMQFANRVLQMSKPLFERAAKAVNNLLNSLNASLDSSPVKAFFDYMNKKAGPMFETTGKAIGNFMQGFMSMMVAFGPLAEKTAQGFLNMSKNFAQWASGLSKSEKFRQFVDYINENMPKVRAIFRDALAGMVYMFSAFGPLSEDMMTSLQNMMARFKEWGRTLGENQQFQQFIEYIRENAPKVIELIGNLTNFLINLGVGLAPLGSTILGIVNNMLVWTNSIMQANPWIGQLIGALIMMTGAFKMLIPIVIASQTLFKGLLPTLKNVFSNIIKYFLPFKGSLVIGLKMLGTSIIGLGKKFMLGAARIAASWFVAMGPVGWVIGIVVGLVALIIANWDTVKKWTLKIWGALPKDIQANLLKISNFVKSYMTKTWNDIKIIFNFITQTFKNSLRILVAFVRGDFQAVKNIARDQMQLMKDTVKKFLDNIVQFFKNVNLYNSGKAIIQSAIDGLNAMKGKILGVVENIVGTVRDFWPFSPAKRGPLSDIHRMDFGGPISSSIGRASSTVMKSMQGLANIASNAFGPELEFSDIRSYKLDTTDGHQVKGIQHAFNAEISNFELPEKNIVIVMNDREVGRGVYKHVHEFLEINKSVKERFR